MSIFSELQYGISLDNEQIYHPKRTISGNIAGIDFRLKNEDITISYRNNTWTRPCFFYSNNIRMYVLVSMLYVLLNKHRDCLRVNSVCAHPLCPARSNKQLVIPRSHVHYDPVKQQICYYERLQLLPDSTFKDTQLRLHPVKDVLLTL